MPTATAQPIIQYKNAWSAFSPSRGVFCISWKQELLLDGTHSPPPCPGAHTPSGMVFTFRGSTSIRPRFLSKHAGVIFQCSNHSPGREMNSKGDSGHPQEAEDGPRRGSHCCEMKSSPHREGAHCSWLGTQAARGIFTTFFTFFFNEKEKEDLLWRVSGYFMSKPVVKIWNENFHQ